MLMAIKMMIKEARAVGAATVPISWACAQKTPFSKVQQVQ